MPVARQRHTRARGEQREGEVERKGKQNGMEWNGIAHGVDITCCTAPGSKWWGHTCAGWKVPFIVHRLREVVLHVRHNVVVLALAHGFFHRGKGQAFEWAERGTHVPVCAPTRVTSQRDEPHPRAPAHGKSNATQPHDSVRHIDKLHGVW